MRRALKLAERGRRKTSPNPMVGAVVVRNGKIVGEGWHSHAGGPHAEVIAVGKAGKLARGAALFINLEPCCHYGRTPPCAPKIVDSGIRTVFASIVDPDPRVNGRGLRFLRRHQTIVNVGLLAGDARKLNEAYITWITKKRPFVAVKVSESLDGRLAASDGSSRGLGSSAEIKFVHALRAKHDAVLVGVGTILKDNPRLTVRCAKGPNPHRIIFDSRLRAPISSETLKRNGDEKIIVVCLRDAPEARIRALESRGIEVWRLGGRDGRVNIRTFLSEAARRSIQSILVEGGSDVITSFLKERCVDRVYVAVAPKILGGDGRFSWPKEIGVRNIRDAIQLEQVGARKLGCDVLLEGYLFADRGGIKHSQRRR